mmetsp:Transcript_23738/g.38112  ORF Transcript_23738/g.38112 Transcript_23738/m.38112 type:complete len:96 (+) Transcript_23738:146-433(+)
MLHIAKLPMFVHTWLLLFFMSRETTPNSLSIQLCSHLNEEMSPQADVHDFDVIRNLLHVLLLPRTHLANCSGGKHDFLGAAYSHPVTPKQVANRT